MKTYKIEEQELIAIVGPTCVGKSKVTQVIIENFPIEIINLDSFMVYSHFSIGTGRSDVSNYKRHLYGFVSPLDNLSGIDYVKLVRETIPLIQRENNIPIFEGGSITYLRALLKDFKIKIIGILAENDQEMKENIENRLDSRLANNILTEVQNGLELGYRDSRVLQDDVVYLPLVDYLDGKISLSKARERIVSNLNNMIANQVNGYKDFKVEWIKFSSATSFLSDLLPDYIKEFKTSYII